VTPDHLQRGATALWRELHASIRHVLDQSRLGQSFHHAADRGRRDFEHFGDVAGVAKPPWLVRWKTDFR